jgi:hypothetical protein
MSSAVVLAFRSRKNEIRRTGIKVDRENLRPNGDHAIPEQGFFTSQRDSAGATADQRWVDSARMRFARVVMEGRKSVEVLAGGNDKSQ